jgi:hypothetical protein
VAKLTAGPVLRRARRLRARSRDVGLSVVLALQGCIMFVVAPLAATGMLSPTAVDVFRFALAASAVLLVTRSRAGAVAIVLTCIVSLGFSLALRQGPAVTAVIVSRVLVTGAFDLAVAAAVARVAFAPGRVTIHRILGAVILYLSIGLLFANAYRACALLLHPSFSGLPADRRAALSQLLYFSLGALTSSGAPDVTPLHPFVRSLTNLESVIGQLFPPTLLARLVTLHAARDPLGNGEPRASGGQPGEA